MYCFSFTATGYGHAPDLSAESNQAICEKALLDAVQPGLFSAGFDCDQAEFENNMWKFQARKNGTTYLVGCQVAYSPDHCDAQIFIRHKRGMLDRLLSRNVPAPQNYSEKSLRDALKALPGISDLQESRKFREIAADNAGIAAIQQ